MSNYFWPILHFRLAFLQTREEEFMMKKAVFKINPSGSMKNKFLVITILVIIIAGLAIAFTNKSKDPKKSADQRASNENTNSKPSNENSNLNSNVNENTNAAKEGSGQKSENTSGGAFNLKSYTSLDKSWQISTPSKFTPATETTTRTALISGEEVIALESDSSITNTADKFSPKSSKKITIAEVEGTYTIEDSKEQIEGKPKEMMLSVTFTRNNINYKLSDKYKFSAETEQNKENRFDAIIKSLKFLN